MLIKPSFNFYVWNADNKKNNTIKYSANIYFSTMFYYGLW